MSVQVPLDEIPATASDYGDTAFVLVSAVDGPPRVTHAQVQFVDDEIVVSIGRRAAGALLANPTVSVLWPGNASQSMSLIVDGVVAAPPDPDGGEIRITPTGAVRHRPASG